METKDYDRVKELRSALILLLSGLGMSKTRIMLTMAIIVAYQIEEEMGSWVATYYGKSDDMTIEAFMAKLNELTDDNND